jgi:hypothetical protein
MAECEGLALVTFARIEKRQDCQGGLARVATASLRYRLLLPPEEGGDVPGAELGLQARCRALHNHKMQCRTNCEGQIGLNKRCLFS